MTAVLNSLFDALSPLWEMSLTAAYVTAVVVVLRLILKKRAPRQVLCVLWLVVFARLLIPVSLESPLSIVPDTQQVQMDQDLSSKLTGGQAQQPGGVTAGPVSQGSGGGAYPALSVPGGAAPGTPQGSAQGGFPWQTLAAGVWLAGALAMCLYGLISYLRLKSRLFDAIRAEDGAWEHPSIGSPFILGMIRPRIYLPAGLWGMPRRFILCHERAHLRRLDHIVKPVCWAALALHWFNPAVWIAFILMSRDIEAACDEAVIRQLGPRVKADYSATLLSLATNGRVPAPCPLAFDEGDAKGRIQNVLRYRRPTLWIVVVSVVMALMAAVCLLTDPVSAKEPDPAPSQSQGQEAGLNGLLDPWMEEVLKGERTFSNGQGEFNIHQLRTMVYGDEELPKLTIEVGKLALMDLDKDGINEMVVWPTGEHDDPTEVGYYVGYFIFRRQGDEVQVYYQGWRPVQNLKADGTFEWSSSAANWGTASMSFDGVQMVSHSINWCDNGVEEHYFVNGAQATREEFEAACAAHEAKPEPTWYVFEGGQLKAPASSAASINVPIPLDDAALSVAVPDFLDEEQQLLYRQAFTMYRHLFGANTEWADSWSEDAGFVDNTVLPDGYIQASGLYANWNDFEEAVLSVFTQEYWNTKNDSGAGAPIYKNVDGRLCYVSGARGSYGYNENFPETFRLVEQTDDTISFVMTGYYSEPYPLEGESIEDRDARLASYWDYSIEFPLRMVKTERGWRFNRFHNARTDNALAPFSSQQVPNPNLPAAVTSAPEPTPSAPAEPVVISELYGMQLVSVGDRFQLNWKGRSYPVGPDISYGDLPWVEDFDEDGQPEALFYGHEDGSYPFTIYDVVNGELKSSALPDINEVYRDVSLSSVAAYHPVTGGLTMTFPWGEGDSRRYVTINTTLSSDFFTGCEELADGRPLRMSVKMGSISGMFVPRGFSYRASVTLTDGVIASPEVGYMWFGIQYSDSGFTVRTPEASDFGTDIRA